MKIVPPTTFEEELNSLRNIFFVTLDKYETCMKLYSSAPSSDQKQKCDLLAKQLNEIINIKCDELKKNIATATINLDTYISDMNFNMKSQKGMKNTYTGNLMRLDRGDLAAEPRRVAAYEQKVYHLCNLFFYLVGTVAIVYYFQKELKLEVPKGKAVAKPKALNRSRERVGGKPPGGKPQGTKGVPKAPPKPGAPGKGKAGPGKGKAAPGKGKAAPGKGKAAAGKGKAAPGKGKAAPGKGKAAPGKGKAAPGKGKAAPGKGKAAAGKGKAAAGKPAGKGAPNLRRQAMAKAAARAAARRRGNV